MRACTTTQWTHFHTPGLSGWCRAYVQVIEGLWGSFPSFQAPCVRIVGRCQNSRSHSLRQAWILNVAALAHSRPCQEVKRPIRGQVWTNSERGPEKLPKKRFYCQLESSNVWRLGVMARRLQQQSDKLGFLAFQSLPGTQSVQKCQTEGVPGTGTS